MVKGEMEIQQSWRKFIWLRKSYLIWHKTSKAPKSSSHRVHTHAYIHSGETLFTIKKVYTRFQTLHMIDVDKEFRLWYYVIWNLKLHAWMKLMKKIFLRIWIRFFFLLLALCFGWEAFLKWLLTSTCLVDWRTVKSKVLLDKVWGYVILDSINPMGDNSSYS